MLTQSLLKTEVKFENLRVRHFQRQSHRATTASQNDLALSVVSDDLAGNRRFYESTLPGRIAVRTWFYREGLDLPRCLPAKNEQERLTGHSGHFGLERLQIV